MTIVNVDKTQTLIQKATADAAKDIPQTLCDLQDNFTDLEKIGLKMLGDELSKTTYPLLAGGISIMQKPNYTLACLLQTYAIIADVIHRNVDPVNVPDMEEYCKALLHSTLMFEAIRCKKKHDYHM